MLFFLQLSANRFFIFEFYDSAKNHIVKFYDKYSNKGKSFTVQHFMKEGLSLRTIYRTLQTFKERGMTKRKDGSGRPAKILTKKNLHGCVENWFTEN